MSDNTGISWATTTWNPAVGCTPCSEGCVNCYAGRLAHRFSGPGGAFEGLVDGPKFNGMVRIHPERLTQPIRWEKRRTCFVCSMGDLFHDRVPKAFIHKVFDTMTEAWGHTFLVLTKRAKGMRRFLEERAAREGAIPARIWCGVTCENRRRATERLHELLGSPARSTFVSFEPLLGPVELDEWQWHRLGWVIAGGETGPKRRFMNPDWARRLRDGAAHHDVPFHLKDLGGLYPGHNRVLDGQIHDATPPFDHPMPGGPW